MKEINDRSQIEKWIREGNIMKHFETRNISFRAFVYEKGEVITSPLLEFQYIFFVIRGKFQVYALQKGGSIGNIGLFSGPAVLGDMEYTTNGQTSFFSEARSEVICLALSVREYGDELYKDVPFLHMMLESVTQKLVLASTMEFLVPDVEEKLIFYLKNITPERTLSGVGTAAMWLHCSQRQLQRVIKKLCDEGRLLKVGKGKYTLLS